VISQAQHYCSLYTQHDCIASSTYKRNPSRGCSMWCTSAEAGLMQMHAEQSPVRVSEACRSGLIAETNACTRQREKACSVCTSPSEVCVGCGRTRGSHSNLRGFMLGGKRRVRVSPPGALEAAQPMLRVIRRPNLKHELIWAACMLRDDRSACVVFSSSLFSPKQSVCASLTAPARAEGDALLTNTRALIHTNYSVFTSSNVHSGYQELDLY